MFLIAVRAAWFPLTPTDEERLETRRKTSFQTAGSRSGKCFTLVEAEAEEEPDPDEDVVPVRCLWQQTRQSDSE